MAGEGDVQLRDQMGCRLQVSRLGAIRMERAVAEVFEHLPDRVPVAGRAGEQRWAPVLEPDGGQPAGVEQVGLAGRHPIDPLHDERRSPAAGEPHSPDAAGEAFLGDQERTGVDGGQGVRKRAGVLADERMTRRRHVSLRPQGPAVPPLPWRARASSV